MRKSVFILSACALLLAGCRAPERVAQTETDPAQEIEQPVLDSDEAPKPAESSSDPESVAESPSAQTTPAQQKGTVVQPWKETKETPAVELAKKVDAMIKNLSGVRAKSKMLVGIQEGTVGFQGEAKIKDAKTFRVQYPSFKQRIPITSYIIANGRDVGEIVEGKKGESPEPGLNVSNAGWNVAPVGELAAQKVSVNPLKPTQVPRMVFAGLADGTNTFADFMRQLESADYKLTVDERVTEFNGQRIKNYRVLAKKDADSVEIVVDGNLHLPVTINAYSKGVGPKPETLRWSTAWYNNEKFTSEDFKTAF